jgi:hypothetical protein
VGDWEGKAEVPSALPCWFEVYKRENQTRELPGVEKQAPVTVTGATPEPGYFITRARVKTGSTWKCWIEVNLSGDYNDQYQEYNQEAKTIDAFGNGQPALIYSALIDAAEGSLVTPLIAGMCIPDFQGDNLIRPLKGITTADSIFDEISIALLKPNPSIIK